MGQKKNYNLWYKISLALFVTALLVHISGYITNMFYLLAWILWMPTIAFFLIGVFDFKNSTRQVKNKILSKKTVKSVWFTIFIIVTVYVVFNIIYNMSIVNDATDIIKTGDTYYVVKENGNQPISYSEYVKYSLAGFRFLSGSMLAYLEVLVLYYDERRRTGK